MKAKETLREAQFEAELEEAEAQRLEEEVLPPIPAFLFSCITFLFFYLIICFAPVIYFYFVLLLCGLPDACRRSNVRVGAGRLA
jgi:hypothetical protein